MSKENILFSIVGVLLGFIVGFGFANSVNRSGAAAVAPQAQQMQGLPPDHPPVTTDGRAPVDTAAVTAAVERGKAEPDNFDAQTQAGAASYQTQKYDDAVRFWKRANQLKPDDYQTIVSLGNAEFDAERFEEAERWYTAALKQRPDDISVRTDLGLSFFLRARPDVDRAIAEYRGSLQRDPRHTQTLQNLTVALAQKGQLAEAEATLAKLEAVSPDNPAVANIRADLQQKRNAGQTPAAATNAQTSPAQ